MNFKTIIIFGLIILLLIASVVILIYVIKNLKKQNKEYKENIEKQKHNIEVLLQYAEDVASIKEDKEKINTLIERAKNDEEISDIVNIIVDINNSKLQKSATSKNRTSAKTSKK